MPHHLSICICRSHGNSNPKWNSNIGYCRMPLGFQEPPSMAWFILHIWLLFRHQSHMIGKTTNTKCSNVLFLTIPISTENYPLLFFSQNDKYTQIIWTHSIHRPGGRGVMKMAISQILHVSASLGQGRTPWFQLLRERKLFIMEMI